MDLRNIMLNEKIKFRKTKYIIRQCLCKFSKKAVYWLVHVAELFLRSNGMINDSAQWLPLNKGYRGMGLGWGAPERWYHSSFGVGW